jgi:hypothetical protein
VLEIPANCPVEGGLVDGLVFNANVDGSGLSAFALREQGVALSPEAGEATALCGGELGDLNRTRLSPDGWIASLEEAQSPDGFPVGDLWISHAEDPGIAYRFTDGQCAADPVWSPNGNYLAFKSTCQDAVEGAIWIVPAPHVVDRDLADPVGAGHLSIDLPGIERLLCWVDRDS